MIYCSKRDWWIAALVLPVCLVVPALGIFLLSLALMQAAPALVVVPGLSMLIIGLLISWLFLSTTYEITSAELIVRLGPLKWRVPVEAITEVVSKKALSNDMAWGVAWSLDRLIIRYRKPSGRMAFLGIAISPADKEVFLRELAETMNAQDRIQQISVARMSQGSSENC
jgi:hypothetical protein